MSKVQPDAASESAKTLVRREMLAKRRALAPEAVASASAVVTRGVLALPQWAAARTVLLYWPVRNEVDIRALAERALAEGRTLLLPRCRPGMAGLVDLGRIENLSELVPGCFGIPEPAAAICHPPESFQPDFIGVPGVAFDRAGRRLGFGGGYYDRLLAVPSMGHAAVVGLAYDFQVVERLPVEEWDRPMDILVTERTTHHFRL